MLKYVYIHSAFHTYTGKTMISIGMLTHTKKGVDNYIFKQNM